MDLSTWNVTETNSSAPFSSISAGLWTLAILVFFPLCVATVAGNVLVLLAFKKNKKLRTVTNYFLVSLAVSDLLIGLVSMPLYSIYIIVVSVTPFVFNESRITFLNLFTNCSQDKHSRCIMAPKSPTADFAGRKLKILQVEKGRKSFCKI